VLTQFPVAPLTLLDAVPATGPLASTEGSAGAIKFRPGI